MSAFCSEANDRAARVVISSVAPFSGADPVARLRRLMLAILIFGIAGTTTELLLIGHDEDVWQLIPIGVLALGAIGAVTMLTTAAGSATVVLFRSAMALMMAAGALGAVLHYRANMEFKLEMDPTLSGFRLFMSVVQATAPPALAPGSMVLLGLIGMAGTYGLTRSADPRS